MKQKILLLLLLAGIFFSAAKANESEPNDTRAQANVLPLNGNNTGAIGTATDVDWYKVTTTTDGQLNLTLAVSNGLYTYFTIYDNDGTTVLQSTYTAGTSSYSVDGLAVGTYYIQIYPYYPGQMPAYTLSNTLTAATPANDAEPDSTRAQALVLPLNGSKTGHIGYYYNHHRDSVDVYKVTTTADGRLRLTMASANGQNVYIDLYDNNGTILLGSAYTAGTAVLVDKDGLAAGTYYVRIHTYYTTEFAPYTLSDSLFVPTIANDVEPDSTRAQALVLPLNGSKTGHIGYYYNNHRDSVDWYKVTTNADGRLRLTMTSANGQNVYANLFDNNGTTLLASAYTASSAVLVNLDGLAAGTYYIRVNTYYNTEFAPYTLSDSLFKPTEANDAEPDSTKATALTLPLNGSVTGHVNYYYNNHRDSVDEYKLTTNADGNINLNLSILNNTPVFFNLYDNDGTTLLHQQYTPGNDNYNVDGLAQGTYYVKVFTYYNNQFAPYTLKNTLSTYNANDAEPNKYAKQAKTLNSDQDNSGHVNFYYNNVRDSIDWFKINYTGKNGNMSVTLKVIQNITGAAQNAYMQIYKDTTVAPVYSAYTTTTETANLTGLAQGYYYVRIFEYFNNQFTAYTVTPTFVQTKALIVTTSYDTIPNCSLNTITYKLSKSHSPYSVTLFRFGTRYTTASAKGGTITFDSLPVGIYYATVYGDGATGTAKGRSDTISLMAAPTNTQTLTIKATQAKLSWTKVTCASYDSVQYRVHGTGAWTGIATTGNVASYILTGLTPNTSYDWRVAAIDSEDGMSVISAFTSVVTFATSASLVADENNNQEDVSVNNKNAGLINVSPNPVSSYFTIHHKISTQQKLTASLFDFSGKAVWSSGSINADALNGKKVIVNQFGSGLYYLKITDAQGAVLGTIKVSITK